MVYIYLQIYIYIGIKREGDLEGSGCIYFTFSTKYLTETSVLPKHVDKTSYINKLHFKNGKNYLLY